jgi:hypothetical protein
MIVLELIIKEKRMLEFLQKLENLIISTKEKLREPITAPRRKVILVGIGIVVLFCAVLLI